MSNSLPFPDFPDGVICARRTFPSNVRKLSKTDINLALNGLIEKINMYYSKQGHT